MRRRLIPLPSILLLLALVSCASGGNDFEATQEPEEEVSVTVRNDGFYDAKVYLLRGAERRRLGTVNGNSTQTFTLARHLIFGLTDLRFGVDWIGRRGTASSETIIAQPGDNIRLTIR